MLSKGLTNYPVLVLTIISLLAISYLSLTILDKIYRENKEFWGYSLPSKIKYYVFDNSLYVSIDPPIYRFIEEVIIYSNGSSSTYKIFETNGFYGPLIIPDNVSKIVLVGYKNKPILLDILVSRYVKDKLRHSFKQYLPPSVKITIGSRNWHYLLSMNSSNRFYILEPIIYHTYINVTRNKTYIIQGNYVLTSDLLHNRYSIYNTTLTNSTEIDLRFKKLIGIYGSVSEYRSYMLNIYSYKNYTLTPIYSSISRVVTSNPMHITYRIPLGKISTDKSVLLNMCIGVSFNQFEVRDVYGNTYLAEAMVRTRLSIVNTSYSVTIPLGSVFFNLYSQSKQALFSNYTYLDIGTYSLTLIFDYWIYIKQAIPPTTYVVIKQAVYGGFSDNVYIRTYIYDKLEINIGGQLFYYRPVYNNTKANITLHGLLTVNGIVYVINGYNATFLETRYTGNSEVYIVDYANPVSLLICPRYVRIYPADNARVFILRDYNNNTVLYGLYFFNKSIIYCLDYLPVIIADEDYIVLENASDQVYILETLENTYLLHGNNLSTTKIRELHGFILYKDVEYEYPVLIVDNMVNVSGLIIVKYVDNKTQCFNFASGENIFNLRNMIIREIEVIVNNNVKGQLIFSITNDKPIAMFSSNQVVLVDSYERIWILDTSFAIAWLGNSYVIT